MEKITPCLWFNNQAEEAVAFYTSIFKNSRSGKIARYDKASAEVSGQKEGSVLTVEFEIAGQHMTALNGGPTFTFTPAISFYVHCDTPEEVDELHNKMIEGGQSLMPLDTYPFSKRFAWIVDKFGVSWQFNLDQNAQKIAPCLMFVGDQHGKAQEAMQLYTSTFKNSSITALVPYEPGEDKPGIKHAKFILDGYNFIAMDSGFEHKFGFSQATSFVVHCQTQEEVDHFWNILSQGGQIQQCGWLLDKFGIAWQIVPDILDTLLNDPNPQKAQRVMAAMLEMVKLDIAGLQAAYDQE